MKAIYRLSRRIACFDFFIWQAMQQAAGATEIVFDMTDVSAKRWGPEAVKRRIESILLPGPALAGLAYSVGTKGEELAPYGHIPAIKAVKAGLKLPRLKTVLPPGKERYTVTMRTEPRMANRNSNESAWRTFAQEIGARVIEDYDVEPIHLHERMALYAGAEMNFFVTNGPIILCLLSEYPAMGFDVQKSRPDGLEFGESYPWCIPNKHKQIYEPDDLDVIWKHFRHWSDTGTFLE